MKLIKQLLTVNRFSRSGRKLAKCKGIILHYVGILGQRALSTWNYFENDCPRNKHFSSAHYIVDLNGDVYQAIPDDEIAYHCGSSEVDPVSGRVYTDWAREKFERYANNGKTSSPNHCTIGIELCINADGIFTDETLSAAAELVVGLLKEKELTIEDIGHHNMVVGWKNCPEPWVNNPTLFERFIIRVRNLLYRDLALALNDCQSFGSKIPEPNIKELVILILKIVLSLFSQMKGFRYTYLLKFLLRKLK